MEELLDAAVSPANIVITALFAFIIIYWISVIIGLADIDFLDLEIDIDADAEVDGVSVTWLNSVLAFFNLGQIPVMVFFTFLIVPIWALMLIINDFLGNSLFLIGLLVFIPVFIVSLFIAKIFTMPFIKVFGKLSKDGKNESMIGKLCTVTSKAGADKIGQATVKTSGAPFLLNILTTNGTEMNSGDTGLVIEHIQHKNAYLIEPYNH